jgi:hypothetical protein
MLVNLRALLVRLIDIVLLRGGPEHMPASPALLAIIVAANVVLSALIYASNPGSPETWQLQLLVVTVVTLLWFKAAFVLTGKPERFVQTSAAIFGTSTLFTPAILPLSIALIPYLEKHAQDPTVTPPALLSLVAAAIGIWWVVVQVRIIRAAFDWTYFATIVFFFALNIATAVAYGVMFGLLIGVPPGKI